MSHGLRFGSAMLVLAGLMSACTLAGTVEDATPVPDERALLAEAGKRQFLRCNACHSLSAEDRPMLGPHLEDLIGRRAASVEGFAYSAEMAALDLDWDDATLDRWLERPQEMIPGVCMPFMGLANPEHRRALIEYLRNPVP